MIDRSRPAGLALRPLRRAVCALGVSAAMGCADTASELAGDVAAQAPDTAGSAEDTAGPQGDTAEAPDSAAPDAAGPDVSAPECTPEDPSTLSPQLIYDPQDPQGCTFRVEPGDADHEAIQTALVLAQPGHRVCLAEGTFHVESELVVDADDITLIGAGREATVLDFAGQVFGANGVSARGDRFHIEALTVKDTAGDGVRVSEATDVRFKDIAVHWTAPASADNGAYGIYPVQCNGVRIEGCVVSGASDAGIYVGQSIHVLVADNESYGNVAGLEIENTSFAEVTRNDVHDNAGGLLVFNLPGLPIKDGHAALVHGNNVYDNNLENFAPPGNIVAKVPSGTGMFILASDDNEIRDNTITNNRSIGILAVYYEQTLFGSYGDPTFDPYPERNWIHGNTFSGNGTDPQGILKVLQSAGAIPEDIPPVGDTGCVDPNKEGGAEANRNCFQLDADTAFLNVDLCGNFENPSSDKSLVDCTRPAVPAQTGDCAVAEGLPEDQVPGGACGQPPTAQPLAEKTTCDAPYPRLADYGFFVDAHADQPAQGVVPYTVNAPLWADDAEKGRYVALPEGAEATPTADLWELPVGTTLIKHFQFGARRVETRLLIHEAAGWTAHTYLWNDDETEARRFVAGRFLEVDAGGTPRQYVVPSTTQCASCHLRDDAIVPLGLTTRQLARTVERDGDSVQQLAWLQSQGVIAQVPTGDALADPYGDGPVEARARAFLEANCAHCHRDGGPAGVTGLWLTADETDPTRLGICKPPTAAGAGSGDRLYDIVPGKPDESIVTFRMASTNPAIKMPELPNLTVDSAGLETVRQWIAGMTPVGCEEP